MSGCEIKNSQGSQPGGTPTTGNRQGAVSSSYLGRGHFPFFRTLPLGASRQGCGGFGGFDVSWWAALAARLPEIGTLRNSRSSCAAAQLDALMSFWTTADPPRAEWLEEGTDGEFDQQAFEERR